ncbi:MAG: hypothetical protein L0215_26440 [Gemmataceae bacterium]|nr:hypothetical protein [Gemmataceae bacterium]
MMLGMFDLESWKTFFEMVFYIVGAVAAVIAVLTYYWNAKLEQSRWLSSLYQRFYEQETLKPLRDLLDDPIESDAIRNEVNQETSRFTDYLNFFEYLGYLVESGRIGKTDADAIFGYYLACLQRHPTVQDYIKKPDKGFERLQRLLWPSS